MDALQSAFAGTFEQFLEAMPDGIVIVGADGHILFANGRAEAVSGYSRSELLRISVEELVPEGLRFRHASHRASYNVHPTVRPMGSHLDIRVRRKDGSEFPADIALSPVTTDLGLLVIASVRDVTDRKQAEAELLEAQERFRLVVEGVRDYAILMLDPEGNVTTWNPGAQWINGYTAQEAVGRHFSIFYPQADVAAGKPARALAAARAEGWFAEEGWRVRKDGARFWASVVITALREQNGELRGFAKITRDVTERKRQDDRLRALLEVAQSILEGHEDEVVLQLIASRARALLDADLAAVAISDPEDDSFSVRAAAGARSGALQGLRVPFTGSPRGGVGTITGPIVLADASTELTLAKPLLGAAGAGPALIVPLASSGRLLGVLAVANEIGGSQFNASDVQSVELFAAQAAVAMDYTRVRQNLERFALLEDRERIGRELHDGAIQALFAVGMGLQGAALMTADASLRERLEGSVVQIDEVIRDLRNYIFGLRPGLAADRHLSQALRELAQQLEQQHGVPCAVDVDEVLASRLSPRAGDIVQLTREAVSNVGRHAAAITCRISLRQELDRAVLEVEDDGRGFVPRESQGKGWGLRNLEQRAVALGGALEITSVPGEGTTVRFTIPL